MFSLIDLTIWQLGIELQGFELHHNLTTIMNDGRDYSIRLPIQKVPSGPPCPAGVIARSANVVGARKSNLVRGGVRVRPSGL